MSTDQPVTIRDRDGFQQTIAKMRQISQQLRATSPEAAIAAVRTAATSPDTGTIAPIYKGTVDAFGTAMGNAQTRVTQLCDSTDAVCAVLEGFLTGVTGSDTGTARTVSATGSGGTTAAASPLVGGQKPLIASTVPAGVLPAHTDGGGAVQ
ncbi:hypothetical protein [Tsukamurella soli]|uniref:Excreted virulence factor EspC, type VII ESX diderm n=1 Tax=Tsukamurella soli TaxID=644556 RepID=A0ABP8J7B8_9ACTN